MTKDYDKHAHAMQTGVGMKMGVDPSETSPKHLRVGINAAMSDQGGLVTLLIEKGLITKEEYLDAITTSMERESNSYKDYLEKHTGSKITLI